MQPSVSAVRKPGFVTHWTKGIQARRIPGPTSVRVPIADRVAWATAVPSSWAPAKSRDGTTGAATGNTLVYILSYPSLEARQKSWDAFRNDPEWNRVRTESEKDGKIVDKVESVFLKATDYSTLK